MRNLLLLLGLLVCRPAMAHTDLQAARHALRQGHYSSAKAMLQEVLRQTPAYAPLDTLAAAHTLLAEAYRATDQFAIALQELETAKALAKSPLARASVHNGFAGVFFQLGQYDSVHRHLGLAEALCGFAESPTLRLEIQIFRAAAWRETGMYAQALAVLDSALAYAWQAGPNYYMLALFNKMQVLEKQGNTQLATGLGQKLLALSKEYGFQAYDRMASQLLALYYHKLGNARQEFKYMQEYSLYQDLFEEETRRTMEAVAHEHFMLYKKEAENKLLRRKAKVAESRLVTEYVFAALLALLAIGLGGGLWRMSRIAHRQRKLKEQAAKEQQIVQLQNKELSTLNTAKDELLAFISSDFKEPLTLLKSGIDIAEASVAEGKDTGELLAYLLQNVEKTSTLLDEVLVWAKSQMQGFEAQIHPVNLADQLDMAIDEVAELARARQISLVVKAPPQLQVESDGELLRLVLRTLLNTCIRHSPPGSQVHLRVLADVQPAIEVAASSEPLPSHIIKSLNDRRDISLGAESWMPQVLSLCLARDLCIRLGTWFNIEQTADGKRHRIAFSPLAQKKPAKQFVPQEAGV